MATSDGTLNGKAATDDANRLARANYADRAVAALPDSRGFIRDLHKLVGVFDPDHVSLEDMRRMRRNATIKMALHYGKAPLTSADYTFQCDDPRIAQAAKESYDEIHLPLMQTALNSWDFGYQGAVKQFEYGRLETTYEDSDSGEVKPVWDEGSGVDPILMGVPIPLPPEVTEPKLVKGRFGGILTSLARLRDADDAGNQESGLVPPEWSLWFAHLFNEEFHNYYGCSRLVPAYEPWYSFKANWFNRDRHADQDADPALQVWYPSGNSFVQDPSYPDDPTKTLRVSNRDSALEVGRNLRNGATIAWPSDVYIDESGHMTVTRKWTAEFLTGGENLGAFTELLNDLRVEMIRGCLVPEQTLIEAIQGTGARNVAQSHTDLYIMSLELESRYLDRIINRYYVRPFVEANFGKDAPKCIKKTTGFQQEDMTLATTLIEAAFTADPNALPIKFEEMLEQASIPQYSKKEQEERQKAVEEAQQAAADQAEQANVGALPGEAQAGPGQPVASPDAQALSAAQEHRRLQRRPYDPRERIYLSSARPSTAPEWARDEDRRRRSNVGALAERLRDVVHARYQDVFEACAESLADVELSATTPVDLALARKGGLLGRQGLVDRLARGMKDAIKEKVGLYAAPLRDEMASMYHASGQAELTRLGLSGESWDVGRREVQDWAAAEAGRLIKTIDETVVESHVRPWLESTLGDPTSEATFIERAQGIPVSSVELAAQLSEKFAAYPQWMAERVVRTEAATGYNLSAADMWERVGVTQVKEFDGLGGKSGMTDEECLARNGRVVTIEQFRQDTRDEHPNGSLGGTPVYATVKKLAPLEPAPVLIHASAHQRPSGSLYAVTPDGWILDQAQTGELLASA